MKQIHVKLIKIGVIVLILFAAVAYFFMFKLKGSDIKDLIEVMEFSKEGFVDANELTNENKLVAENSKFELYLDETTSHFTVKDKTTGKVIQSNPGEEDTRPDAMENKKNATLEVTYLNRSGSESTVDNYRYSISHGYSGGVKPEGYRSYQIKEVENGFQVNYLMEKIEIDYLYFPMRVPLSDLDTVKRLDGSGEVGFSDALIKVFDDQYNYRDGEFFLDEGRYERLRLVKALMFPLLYQHDEEGNPLFDENGHALPIYEGYSRDEIIEKNAEYGYTKTVPDQFKFELAIQVLLTEEGFETTLIHNSIQDSASYKMINVDFFPYLGTAVDEIENDPTEGYMVIPDGSGAVIEFNSLDRTSISPYKQRIYGQDFTLQPFVKPEDRQKISLPLYGMVKKDDIGFAAIIKNGDAMTDINADSSGRYDNYNKIYPTFRLRESEIALIGTAYSPTELKLWTDKLIKTDFVTSYVILSEANNSYMGIAKAYQDYLIKEYDLKPLEDISKSKVTLELLGAYDQKDFILGIPYNKTKSLTTFDQAIEIIDSFDNDLMELNILYKGVLNGGLKSSIQTKAKYESALGGKKGYKNLQQRVLEYNANLYLQVNITQASGFSRKLDNYKYAAQRLDSSHARVHTYHLPTGLVYSATSYPHSPDDYVINPKYYDAVYNKLSKKTLNSDLSFLNLGSRLGGHYNKKQVVYKEEAKYIQQNLLKDIETNVMLTNPLGYAYPYADYIVDLPTSTTEYQIISYRIPLVQLILSGYIGYSSGSVNLMTDRSEQQNFLRILETGSDLKYTLTYDNPSKLIETEYNMFLSTHYIEWIDKINDKVEELNSLQLNKYHLISHERIANNVYKVGYGDLNNNLKLEIYINYNQRSFDTGEFVIGGLDYHYIVKE